MAKIVRLIARKIAAGCLLALCASLVVDCAGHAQAPATGRIIGVVRDESGGVLPGVTVRLAGSATERSAVTDANGRFMLDELPAETIYVIRAQLPGFRDATQEGLFVEAGATVMGNLSMRVSCLEEVQYVVDPPFDQLLKADAVVHLRVVEDSRLVEMKIDDCNVRDNQASGLILGVGAFSRGEWRPGAIVQISSESPVKAGTEYLAFLSYSEYLQRYTLGLPTLAVEVNAGRVEWSEDEQLGFRNGAPINQALALVRDLHRRHTRYRRHDAGGTEAPLEALRYNTGWFDIGILERDRDVWLNPIGPVIIDRPFEFVADPLSPRQIPGKGDRIRLLQGGPISIMDFGSRGEARRNRRPDTWKTESYTANVTGTRVDAGGVYTVADIVVWKDAHLRSISLRLVAD